MKNSLQSKLDEEFYGFVAKQILIGCDNIQEVQLFKNRANAFLKGIISYIEQRYSFSNNKYESLIFFKLQQLPVFENLLQIINLFNIEGIIVDTLYEEYVLLKEYVTQLLKSESSSSDNDYEQKWIKFLSNYNSPNLEKVVNFIFSIPHSNAMSERIFSQMFFAWRKERNHLKVMTIEGELLIKSNFQLSCKEFYDYALKDKNLLQEIRSNEKYN